MSPAERQNGLPPTGLQGEGQLRIAYVTMRFPTPRETFATNDVKILQSLGPQVSVHCLRGPISGLNALIKERTLEDIRITHGGLRGSSRGLVSMIRHPRAAASLLCWILRHCGRTPGELVHSLALLPRSVGVFTELDRNRPDVVHLFWGHYPSLVGYLVSRFLPETVVSVFVGAYDLRRDYGGTRALVTSADVTWTHAHANVPLLLRVGVPPRRLWVVHRGIETKRVKPCVHPKDHRQLVTVAQLAPQKAVDDALRVYSLIRQHRPSMRFLILGQGPLRASLQRLADELDISSAVEFAGHISHAQVFELLCQAPIMVDMSRSLGERLPNRVKEAMLCRCVPVVTRTPGIDELVEEGVDGFLIEQGDVDEAARRVEQLLGNAELAEKMGAKAREKILKEFDVHKSMQQYLEHWQELVVAKRERTLRQDTEYAGGSGP